MRSRDQNEDSVVDLPMLLGVFAFFIVLALIHPVLAVGMASLWMIKEL